MNESPQYIIERMRYGFVVSTEGAGVPMTAMTECALLLSKRGIVDAAIGHHLSVTRNVVRRPVFVMGEPEDLKKWREVIEQEIAPLPPEERWWKGFDVGDSSATIFGLLAEDRTLGETAKKNRSHAAPRTDAEIDCCRRLVNVMGWHSRLEDVARAYPGKGWDEAIPKILQGRLV